MPGRLFSSRLTAQFGIPTLNSNPRTASTILRSIAQVRTQSRRLSANIREAAEASKSGHWDVNGDIKIIIVKIVIL